MADLPKLTVLTAPGWRDYELIDSGAGRKLERFGSTILIRPEHQALWSPALPERRWDAAHGVFHPTSGSETGGRWETRQPIPETWTMQYGRLRFAAHFTSSRHLGVFPEQAAHWDWITQQIQSFKRPVRVLNLFGYTGLATLAAAHAGASVTHVDAAKKSVAWGRENLAMNGLADHPVRWMIDDVLKYVQRANRRGERYEGILLDPPKFGRGPRGEVWEVFEGLPELVSACVALLSEQPLFLVLTAYAIRASALSLYTMLDEQLARYAGTMEAGELASVDSSAGRVLSLALFARWSAQMQTGRKAQKEQSGA